MSGLYREIEDPATNKQEVEISGGTDQTTIGNSGDKLKVDGSGVTQPVSAVSLPLPTGASTAALQTTGNTSLSSIDGKVPANLTVTSTRLLVDGSGVTQPVSAASLPLPAGAATSALQTTGNSSLSSIDTKTPALGQTTMSASQPVAIASNQSAISVTQSGTWTVQPGNTANTTPWLATINQGGNSATVTASNALKVDGSAVTQPVSAASLPLPTGAATAANQSTEIASLSSIDTKTPTLGQKVMSGSQPVTIASDQSSIPVTVAAFSDTAPATQTIIALDSGTSNLTGANGQVFYFGTPTTNSAATFALSSIETVLVESSLLGAGGTLVVEISMDGQTFWLRPNVFQISTQNYTNAFTAPFVAAVNVAGATHIRVRSTVSWTGTATITVKESVHSRMVTIGDALPVGANVIGGVTQSGSWNITNVSGTVSLPTGAATSANQTTMQASLSAIDAGIPAGLGQTTMSASMPVTLASDQSSLNTKDLINVSSQYQAITVSTSAVEAKGAGTHLTNRKSLWVTPTAGTVYWATNSSVTTSNGTPIFKNQTQQFSFTENVTIFLIATGSTDVRVVEAS